MPGYRSRRGGKRCPNAGDIVICLTRCLKSRFQGSGSTGGESGNGTGCRGCPAAAKSQPYTAKAPQGQLSGWVGGGGEWACLLGGRHGERVGAN